MMSEQLSGAAGVARLQCIQNLLVVPHRLLPTPQHRQAEEARALGARQQGVVGGLQHAVASKADDGAMNLLVDLEIIAHLATL